MARPVFPSGRKLLALLCLAGIGYIAVAWWLRPPPEPVMGGVRLSAYMNASPGEKREEIAAFGPAGVRWLAYQLEHGRRPIDVKGPRLFDHAPNWLRERVPQRWGGISDWADRDEQTAAGYMLAAFGDDAAPALPMLGRALESDNEGMVIAAAYALQSIGAISSPLVEEKLRHGSQRVRTALFNDLVWRLEYGRDADATRLVKVAIEALHDPNFDVRVSAISALGKCAYKRSIDSSYDAALPALFEFLSDPDPLILEVTLSTLHDFGDKAAPAVPRLIEMVDAEERRIRASGADAQDEPKGPACCAIWILTDLKAGAAVPTLVRCLDNENRSLNERAAEALQQMGSTSWPAIQEILDYGSERTRSLMLETMGKRVEKDGESAGEAEVAPVAAALEKALSDPSVRVREAAMRGLDGCRSYWDDNDYYDSAIPLLLGLLSDPDRDIVKSAAWACRAFGTKATAATPRLIELLDSDDQSIRCNALNSLAWVDQLEKRSAGRLRALLPHADGDFRKEIEAVLAIFETAPDGESTTSEKAVPAR